MTNNTQMINTYSTDHPHGPPLPEVLDGEGRCLWCHDLGILAAESIEQRDFLASALPPCFDLIITNPPFSKALEFADHALGLLVPGGKLALLLRLGFLESEKRRPWLQANMPSEIYVLSKRPSFDGQGTDSAAYGWFVWQRVVGTVSTTELRLL